jgi:hypothetical protein
MTEDTQAVDVAHSLHAGYIRLRQSQHQQYLASDQIALVLSSACAADGPAEYPAKRT